MKKKKKPSEKPVGRKSHEIRFATLRGHGDSGCEQLKVAGSHFDPTENGVGFSLGEKMGFVFFFGVQSFQDDLAIKVSFPNTKSVYKFFWGGSRLQIA